MTPAIRTAKKLSLAALVLGCIVWIGVPLFFGENWSQVKATIVWIGWGVSMSGAVAFAVAFFIGRSSDQN